MGRNSIKRVRARNKANEKAKADRKAKANEKIVTHDQKVAPIRKRKWAWEFWSEHPEAILCLFFVGIFATPITDFMSKQAKIWSIGLSVWLFCAALIAFVCRSITSTMAQVETNQVLFIKARTSIIRHHRLGEGQHFLFVTNKTNQPEATQVGVMFLAQCTNTGDKTIMMDSFLMEAFTESGAWQDMPVMMIPEDGDLYMCNAPDDAHKTDLLEGSFAKAAHGRNIAPGETVQGWICIAYGKDDFAVPLRMRIRIFDTSGREHVVSIQPSGEVASPGAPIQTASIYSAPAKTDISKIQIVK